MAEIREPIKQTSIEKKNKIIDAGLKVFTEKGYFNTNTAEIAKVAGVSTGIVYQYFKDKKDILIYAVKKHYDFLFKPVGSELEKMKTLNDFDGIMKSVIKIAVELHKKYSKAHEEINALGHLDPDVHAILVENEHRIIDNFIDFLNSININIDNMHERVHIAYNLVESLAHEFVYHIHDEVDNDFMINETTRLIKVIFNIK